MADAPVAARAIIALLEQLEADEELLDRLTELNFGEYESEEFHVTPIVHEQNKNRNIWRLKVWDLENLGLKYRVIYGYVGRPKKYHVFAVVDRDFNYEENHPITKRIQEAYDWT